MTTEPPRISDVVLLRASYRESGEHLREMMEQSQPKNVSWGYWPVIIPAIAALTIWKAILDHKSEGVHWKTVIITFAVLFALTGFLALIMIHAGKAGALSRRFYRSEYRRRMGCDERRLSCEFSESGLVASVEGGISTRFPWTAFVRAIARPKGLLLYTGPQSSQWLPKSVFASEADYDALIRLVQLKVGNFQNVT